MRTTPILAAFAVAAALALPAGCYTSHLDTTAPKDATFGMTCMNGCGKEGRSAGFMVDITFTVGQQDHGRRYGVCCDHLPALRAHLQTVRDYWCDGLDVPQKTVGDLIIGTTVSMETGKRGATIDDGEGYTAFNCGEWLDKLIADTKDTKCCRDKAQSKNAGSSIDRAAVRVR